MPNKISIKSVLKKQEFRFLLLVNFLILCCLAVYQGQHFATDSFVVLTEGVAHNARWLIGQWSFMGGFLNFFFELIGHNPVQNCTADLIVFIVTVSVSMSVFVSTLWERIEKRDLLDLAVIDIAVFISFLNVAAGNYFVFPECTTAHAMAYAFCFWAMTVIAKGDNLKSYIGSGVLLVIAIGFGKAMVSYSAVFLLTICVLKTRNQQITKWAEMLKTFVRHAVLWITSGAVYLVISLLTMKLFNIVPDDRAILTVDGIFGNVLYYFLHQYTYLRWHSYFSTEIMLICAVTIALLCLIPLVSDIIKKQNREQRVFQLITICFAYVCMYIPGFVSTSKGVRTLCAVFLIYFLFSVNAITIVKKPIFKRVVLIVLVAVLSLNIFKFTEEAITQRQTNERDAIWAQQVLSNIEEYEQATGKVINNIGFSYDKERDRPESVLFTTWSRDKILNVYSTDHEDFRIVETPDSIYQEHFADKNWKAFKEEQLVFVDDTLYICIY